MTPRRPPRRPKYRRVREPPPHVRWTAVCAGYGIAGAVVWHFLNHNEPYNAADVIRAVFGMVGLQVGVGRTPTEMIYALGAVWPFGRNARRDARTGQFRALSAPRTGHGAGRIRPQGGR